MRPSERFADHLVFRSRPELPNRGAVALVGHLDTVFPPGTFEGYRSDDATARGPGRARHEGRARRHRVRAPRARRDRRARRGRRRFASSSSADEEVGSPEGQGVIAAAISGSSACLVFEAGREADAIITRRKGTGGMTAIAHGRAAHAGNAHEEGANAIWAAARFVDAVQRLTDYDRGVTVNVGRIVGRAQQEHRARSRRGAARPPLPDAGRRRAARRVDPARRGGSGGGRAGHAHRAARRHRRGRRSSARRRSARLCAEYAACARAHGLGSDEAPLIGGGSDASTAAALGIPAIDGLGPRGAGFHTKDERIELASLVPKAQALARFLAQRAIG